MKKLVLFGAGKIGRSFIGQLFAASGYEVVFIDIDEKIVDELNSKNRYKVIIKSNGPDKVIWVENVRGVLASNKERVISELVSCNLAAVSVGQKGLSNLIPLIAEGIKKRTNDGKIKDPLDIIIAENMRNADKYIRSGLIEKLGATFPIDELVGLIETSIGKMVPIMPQEVIVQDILLVYAEPYNTLILDKKAFKNPIPQVEGLAPKDNIKAWVDRKSYIHNFGHAAVAYAGYVYNPDQKYIYEALSNPAVKTFTIKAMRQSASVLIKKYPEVFTKESLDTHINDLVLRFENNALKDTIFRVGCDLQRKLHVNDRILSPLVDGMTLDLPVDYIMMVFGFGLCFEAKDENGYRHKDDIRFSNIIQEKGLGYLMNNIVQLSPKKILDLFLIHHNV